MSDKVKKSVGGYWLISLIFAVVQICVILIFFNKSDMLLQLIFGTAYGIVYIDAMFLHMAWCVTKAAGMEEGKAKVYMQMRYTLRMLILVAAIIASVYIPFVNVYAAVIPMVYSRIVLYITSAVFNKKGGDGK